MNELVYEYKTYEISRAFNGVFLSIYLEKVCPSLQSFEPATVREETDAKSKMRKSAAVHDDVGLTLVTKCNSSVVKPLIYIFTKSLSTEIVITDLKIAKVVSPFKSGEN